MTESSRSAKSSYPLPGKPAFGQGDPGHALLQIIDQLELVIGSAMRVPGTNRVIVDRTELLDLVDQLRVAVPDEIQEARDLLMEREELLSNVQGQAERAAAEARAQVESSIEEHELVGAAKDRARQIVAGAVNEGADTRNEANAYALDVLQRLEDELSGNLNTVRGGIRALREDLQLNQHKRRFPEAGPKD